MRSRLQHGGLACTLSLALLAALGACTTSLEANDESAELAASGGQSGSSGNGPEVCDLQAIDGAPVRRLSHVEYARTIADLFPDVALPAMVFAEDPRVHGFENFASQLNPSALLVEQQDTAARNIAEAVVSQSEQLVPCEPEPDPTACGEEFIRTVGAKIFRRPLQDAEVERYGAFFDARRTAISFRGAVELTLHAMLLSPQFLYRLEFGAPVADDANEVALDDYELATRLSYLFWQSMPDEELFRAAAAGELRDAQQLEAQARRMLQDSRATAALVDFHRQWLDFDRVLDENKDPELFPAWNDELRSSIREESDRFVTYIFESGNGTLEELLTSTDTFVDKQLAELYGVPAPAAGTWEKMTLDPNERGGLLSLANFSAAHAHSTNGSPPLRGVAVLERLLCMRPPPPPAGVDTSIDASQAGAKTNREIFEAKTQVAGCITCHEQIDGIGFAFEHYDSIGRYRAEDNGQPVDASGTLNATDVDGEFEGAVELGERLAQSERVKSCYSTNWYRYAFGGEAQADDRCKIEALAQAMSEAGGSVRELLVAIATSHQFRHRAAETSAP
jgi:hypothetical protein